MKEAETGMRGPSPLFTAGALQISAKLFREALLTQLSTITRRKFLKATSVGAISMSPLTSAVTMITPAGKSSDIRVKELHISYEHFPYRTAYEFGGRSADRVTLLDVHCTVETIAGDSAKGFGSMTMGNQWSFPSEKLSYDTTLEAMKRLAERIQKITADY